MTEPPRKRSRLEDVPPTTSEQTVTRDEEFWFDDGNVIIIAEDVEFRVYKGLLAKHSAVFKDMFSLPQPSAALGDMKKEGRLPACPPVIPISDHPATFRYLLRELISGNSLQFASKTLGFEVSSAVIRLGHKYQLDQLVQQATDHLKSYYPATFDEHAEFAVENISGFDPIHHIGVVNLARLTNMPPSLLSTALFFCCGLPPKSLLRGFEREDGVYEQLSPDDLARVLIARAELIKLDARAAIKIFQSEPSPGCTRHRHMSCERLFQKTLVRLGDEEAEKSFDANWELSWVDFALDEGMLFCTSCADMIAEREDDERREIWDRLPLILGLKEE